MLTIMNVDKYCQEIIHETLHIRQCSQEMQFCSSFDYKLQTKTYFDTYNVYKNVNESVNAFPFAKRKRKYLIPNRL